MALHGASGGDNTRERTLLAYDRFEQMFGHPPHTNVMHGRNVENIYWGRDLVRSRIIAAAIARFEPQQFLGHLPGSPFYWGDICRARTRYVRSFETLRPNTLAADPVTPYHDPRTPDVNFWFTATWAVGVRLFAALDEASIERLRAEAGASLMHLYLRHYVTETGDGSYRVSRRLSALLRRLALYSDGWYCPAVELLDRLRAVRSLQLVSNGTTLEIRNCGDLDVTDLAIEAPPGFQLASEKGVDFGARRNGLGQVPLGTVVARGTARFAVAGPVTVSSQPARGPREWERALELGARIGWQYWNGRRSRLFADAPAYVRAAAD